MDDTAINDNQDSLAQAQIKICNKCNQAKPLIAFYKKEGMVDGRSQTCIECTRAASRKKNQSADEIIHQIEEGSFEVDQKWLLKELITQYKDPKCKDRLKALDMIMKVSGYKDTNTDEKAVMDSLLESLKDASKDS